MDKETYVVVTRIESYVDNRGGGRGKRIEFSIIETRQEQGYQSPEVRMVREMVNQLRNMGVVMPFQQVRNLKMVLFLLPEEEKALGINFNVNNVYKLVFQDGAIKFVDITDQFYLVE